MAKIHHQHVNTHTTKPALFTTDPAPGTVTNDDVTVAYSFWVDRCYLTTYNRRKPQLTEGRYRAIRDAIRRFGPETVYCAIDAAGRSEWHQGKNRTGRRYIEPAYILHPDRIHRLAVESPYHAQQRFLDNQR